MEQIDLMNTLKWSELAEIEAYLDLPMDEWDESKSKAKLAFAMNYMAAKRNKPDLTLEDAEKLTIKELADISGIELSLPKGETSA